MKLCTSSAAFCAFYVKIPTLVFPVKLRFNLTGLVDLVTDKKNHFARYAKINSSVSVVHVFCDSDFDLTAKPYNRFPFAACDSLHQIHISSLWWLLAALPSPSPKQLRLAFGTFWPLLFSTAEPLMYGKQNQY